MDSFADSTFAWITVRELRRRWKPLKDGDASGDGHNPVRVRLHRCWSWMQRIEELDDAGVGIDDARLIYGWIALNSLYGRWDPQAREPIGDKPALDAFLRRLFDYDESAILRALLTEQRGLVKSIVGDEYLSRYFWKDPGEDEARQAQNAARKLASWYVEGRHASVLDLTLQRVYLARCQLVHGAATYNSGLNRAAVQRCAEFLGMFLRCASVVIIDHAWDDDWGDLCYPPIDTQQGG